MTWFSAECIKLGLKPLPSVGNFVSVSFGSKERATAANDWLMKDGLIPRMIAGYGMPEFLRITVGTEKEMKLVQEAWLASSPSTNERANVRQGGPDRHRADRRLDRARSAQARPRDGDRGGDATARDGRQSQRAQLADHCGTDLAAACDGADLVIVCTPVGACGEAAKTIAPRLKKGCIVSDVGSVKQAVIEAMQPHIPEGVHFVPAHPVAGTEHSGPEAALLDLFQGRFCILTPLPDSDAQAVDGSKPSGRAWAARSTASIRPTTTASSPSPRICRT